MVALGVLSAVRPLDPRAIANPDPNHTHVDFAVWINGEKLDFSNSKYMSAPPTETVLRIFPSAYAHGDEDDGHTVPGREYLHLHDGNGNVIHKHKPGLTLGEFFTSIGFTMTADCFTLDDGTKYCTDGKSHWRMFVNGTETTFHPAYDFQDLDKILLTYGASYSEYLDQLVALTDESCLYSQRCPWKGKPPAENCIADPAVPCTE
jgi:hypothetical protein